MCSLTEEQFWLLVLYRKVPGQLDLDSAEPQERTASLPSAMAAAGFGWSHLLSRQAGCSHGRFALQESLSLFQCVNPSWPTLNSSCFCKTPTQFLMIFKKPGAFKARNKPIRLLAVLAFLLFSLHPCPSDAASRTSWLQITMWEQCHSSYLPLSLPTWKLVVFPFLCFLPHLESFSLMWHQ